MSQVEQLTAALFTEAQERVSKLGIQLDFEQRMHMNTTRQLELITLALQETQVLLDMEQCQLNDLKQVFRQRCGDMDLQDNVRDDCEDRKSLQLAVHQRCVEIESSSSSLLTRSNVRGRLGDDSSEDYQVYLIILMLIHIYDRHLKYWH